MTADCGQQMALLEPLESLYTLCIRGFYTTISKLAVSLYVYSIGDPVVHISDSGHFVNQDIVCHTTVWRYRLSDKRHVM